MGREDYHIDWDVVSSTAGELDTSKSNEKAQKAADKVKELGLEDGYGFSFGNGKGFGLAQDGDKEKFAGTNKSNDTIICPLCNKIEQKAGGNGAYIKCPQCSAPMARNLDKKRTAEEDKVD